MATVDRHPLPARCALRNRHHGPAKRNDKRDRVTAQYRFNCILNESGNFRACLGRLDQRDLFSAVNEAASHFIWTAFQSPSSFSFAPVQRMSMQARIQIQLPAILQRLSSLTADTILCQLKGIPDRPWKWSREQDERSCLGKASKCIMHYIWWLPLEYMYLSN
jgi:hypothetical protein